MLIDQDLHCWKRDLIELVFSPSTAANIFSIPLGVHGGVDLFHWPGTSDGQYTSKEGYDFMRLLLHRDAASSSSTAKLDPRSWKFFWASRALPRCKETCWRAICGLLPLKESLFRRHVDVDPGCGFCASERENEDHIFLQCPAAKHIWFASQLAIRVDSFTSFQAFWTAVIAMDDDEVLAMAQTVVYAIWEARNKVCFQQGELVVATVLRRVASMLEAAQVRDLARAPSVSLPAKWSKPAPGGGYHQMQL
ncbi:uncharacterized protein LOC130711246 [Lotus japonicus]|uniref:uncharacterized protein LOC130711246 n=1 Tax=Lotus japonicus TaxID=34305 RepID=UPI002583A572|nr:uncharacterized protein LOC130711246 [Lotus japonicus]